MSADIKLTFGVDEISTKNEVSRNIDDVIEKLAGKKKIKLGVDSSLASEVQRALNSKHYSVTVDTVNLGRNAISGLANEIRSGLAIHLDKISLGSVEVEGVTSSKGSKRKTKTSDATASRTKTSKSSSANVVLKDYSKQSRTEKGESKSTKQSSADKDIREIKNAVKSLDGQASSSSKQAKRSKKQPEGQMSLFGDIVQEQPTKKKNKSVKTKSYTERSTSSGGFQLVVDLDEPTGSKSNSKSKYKVSNSSTGLGGGSSRGSKKRKLQLEESQLVREMNKAGIISTDFRQDLTYMNSMRGQIKEKLSKYIESSKNAGVEQSIIDSVTSRYENAIKNIDNYMKAGISGPNGGKNLTKDFLDVLTESARRELYGSAEYEKRAMKQESTENGTWGRRQKDLVSTNDKLVKLFNELNTATDNFGVNNKKAFDTSRKSVQAYLQDVESFLSSKSYMTDADGTYRLLERGEQLKRELSDISKARKEYTKEQEAISKEAAGVVAKGEKAAAQPYTSKVGKEYSKMVNAFEGLEDNSRHVNEFNKITDEVKAYNEFGKKLDNMVKNGASESDIRKGFEKFIESGKNLTSRIKTFFDNIAPEKPEVSDLDKPDKEVVEFNKNQKALKKQIEAIKSKVENKAEDWLTKTDGLGAYSDIQDKVFDNFDQAVSEIGKLLEKDAFSKEDVAQARRILSQAAEQEKRLTAENNAVQSSLSKRVSSLSDASSDIYNIQDQMSKIDKSFLSNEDLKAYNDFNKQLETSRKDIDDLLHNRGYESRSTREIDDTVKHIDDLKKNADEIIQTANTGLSKQINKNFDENAIQIAKADEAFKSLSASREKLSTVGDLSDGGVVEQINSIKKLEDEYRNILSLKEKLQNLNVTDVKDKQEVNDMIKDYNNKIKSFSSMANERSYNAIKRAYGSSNEDINKQFAGQIKTIEKSIAQFRSAYSSSLRASGMSNEVEHVIQRVNKLKEAYKSMGASDVSGEIQKIGTLWGDVTSKAEKAGGTVKTFGAEIRAAASSFMQFYTVQEVFFRIADAVRNTVSVVRELDSAMTGLRRVTNETESTYGTFFEGAKDRAQKIGSSVTDVINSTVDFSRLGFNVEDATKLADAALVYKNIGVGVSGIEESTSSIISTLEAFPDLNVDNVYRIVDAFNEVGNTEAVTSGGIGQAMERSAAALAAGNNTLEESVGMIAGMNTVVQDEQKVGTTLKTLSMYLRASKIEAQEAGEETDGMADSVSKLRSNILSLTGNKVDIMQDDNTYKSTFQIMKELSQVWDDLSDIKQANILEMIGGKRNANAVSALIENFDIAERAYNTAMNANGSALEENDIWLESIDGRMAKLSASTQTLQSDIVNADFVKGIVSFANTGVEAIDKLVTSIGTIPTALGAITMAKSAYNFAKTGDTIFGNDISLAVKNYDKLKDAMRQSDTDSVLRVMDQFSNGRAGKNIQKYISDIHEAGNGAQVTFGGMLKAAAGVGEGFESIGLKAKAASLGVGVLSTAFETASTVGISLLAELAVNWIAKMATMDETLRQNAVNAADNFKESQTSLEGYKAEVVSLNETIHSSSSSYEETSAARERLAAIQSELINNYGLEAAGIDLVKQSADEATASLDKLGRFEANKFIGENDRAIETATKKMKTDRFSDNHIFSAKNSPEAKEIARIIDKEYSDIFKYTEGQGYLSFSIKPDVDIREASENITKLQDDIYSLREKYIANGIDFDSIIPPDALTKGFTHVSSELGKIEEKYGSIYDQAIQAKIVSDTSLAETHDTIQSASDKYYDAINKNYDSATERARALKDAMGAFSGTIRSIDLDSISDEGVRNYLSNMISDVTDSQKKIELEVDLADVDSTKERVVGLKDALDDLINTDGKINIDDVENLEFFDEGIRKANDMIATNQQQSDAYKVVADAAEYYGVSISELINLASEYGLCTLDAAYSTEALANAIGTADDAFDSAANALELYNNKIAGGDQDTIFNSYTQAVAKMDEEIKKERTNSNSFWAGAELLLGRDTLEELEYDVDSVVAQYNKIKGMFADPESNGTQILPELYKLQQSGALEELGDAFSIIKNADGSFDFDLPNESYIETISKLADILNVSPDALTSAFEAMGVYSEVTLKNTEAILDNVEKSDYAFNPAKRDSEYKELQKIYQDEARRARELGIDLNNPQTVFGNIDTNNRKVLEWNKQNIDKYKKEIQSWGADINDLAGSSSTVFGASGNFSGVEIAFSPMLQTDSGAVLLSRDTVYDYIGGLLDKAGINESNASSLSLDKILALDAEGMEIEGIQIKNLIADIGDSAIQTGEAMHYVGEDGSLENLKNQLQEIEDSYNSFINKDKFESEMGAAGYSAKDIFEVEKMSAEEYGAIFVSANDDANSLLSTLQQAGIAIENVNEKGQFEIKAEGFEEFARDLGMTETDIDNIKNKLDELSAENPEVSITYDGTIGGDLDVETKKIKYETDAGQIVSELEAGNAIVRSFDLESKEFSYEVNVDAAVNQLQSLGYTEDEIISKINTLNGTNANITFTTNSGEALSNIDLIRSKVKELVTSNNNNMASGVVNNFKQLDNVSTAKAQGQLNALGTSASNAATKVGTVKSALDKIQSKTVTITVNKIETITKKEIDGSDAQGTRNSPGGRTLVGELGPELIADNGVSYLSGVAGPEFVNLGKGAIVFTADETKRILRRQHGENKHKQFGSAQSGRGLKLHGKTIVSNDGNGSSSSTRNNVSSSPNINRGSRGSNKTVVQTETTINYADQEIEKKNEKAIKNIGEQISHIIGDYEHEIFMVEHSSLNAADTAQDIISIYKDMQVAVHDTAEKYRALGLSDNSDYIQKLQEDWYKYADSIKDKMKEAYDEVYKKLENANDLLETQTKYQFERIFRDIENRLSDVRGFDYTLVKETEALKEYESIVEEAKKAGVNVNDPRTLYGNIDTNDRQILTWTTENLEKYKDAILSWYGNDSNWDDVREELNNSYSTIFGASGNYEGIDIAFSPILQTTDGPVMLSKGTVDKYINSIFDVISVNGKGWNLSNFLAIDSTGFEIEGMKIHDLIADIGDSAIQTAEAMHYVGNTGALTEARKWLAEEGKYNVTTYSLLDQLYKYQADRIKNLETEQKFLHEQAEYYRSLGYSDDSDEVSGLSKKWYDVQNEIIDIQDEIVDYLNETVERCKDQLKTLSDVYKTFDDAATEHDENGGFISIDTLSDIIDIGLEYVAYLKDENDEIKINKESLKEIMKLRAQQMAIDSAMAYVERIRLVLTGKSNETMDQLLQTTKSSTDATWNYVYAQLAAVKAQNNWSDTQYQAALKNIHTMNALANQAVANIDKTFGDESESMLDGMNDLIKFVIKMLEDEADKQIDKIKELRDAYADLIEEKKKSLQETRKENDYQDEINEKLKEMAKIQDKIHSLSLDNSRDAIAQRKKLEEQLADLQKDLADKQSDYAYDKQVDTLDDMLDAYNKEKDEEEQAIEDSMKSYQKKWDAAVSYIENNWETLKDQLVKWNYEMGDSLEVEVVKAWDAASEAVQRYGSIAEAVAATINAQFKGGTSSNSIGGNSGILGSSWGTKFNSNDILMANKDGSSNAKPGQVVVTMGGIYMKTNGQSVKIGDITDYRTVRSPEMTDYQWLGQVLDAFKASGDVDRLIANHQAEIDKANSADYESQQTKYNPTLRLVQADGKAPSSTKVGDYVLTKGGLYRKTENGSQLIQSTSEIFGKNGPISDKELQQAYSDVYKNLKEKGLIYHNGGIAGDNESLKQNEVLAKLEKGEMILDKKKELGVYKIIDFVDTLSAKLGTAIGNINTSSITSTLSSAINGSMLKPALAGVSNSNNTITIGDTYIYGADKSTLNKHKDITRGFVNDILNTLDIKR